MSRLIGPREFPDGNSFKSPKPRHKTPSDLRREARRLVQRLEEARANRRDGWPDGKNPYSVDRQERKLTELHGDKRGLRRDVYRHEPALEGAEFRKRHPGRAA